MKVPQENSVWISHLIAKENRKLFSKKLIKLLTLTGFYNLRLTNTLTRPIIEPHSNITAVLQGDGPSESSQAI
ncbi:hypothetical protein A9236_01340 [Polynucleobacter sp. QLW-P1DATA-2]|jgi:hypothetical protein|nr:hypothetical protein A9236_01340 [Polynucleobacter sp. QLW-P1DATA-2]OZB49006.1 MAG: hypothetical protein B7X60_02530 [Polynucleobacter sp. 39-45-136]